MRILLVLVSFLSAAGLCLESAEASGPSAADSIGEYRALAIDCQLRGEAERALDHYEQALGVAQGAFGANSPYLSELYFDMGIVALKADKYPRAEFCLQEAVRLNPNSQTARVKLAELLKLRGKPEDAARQAGSVLAKHKDNLEAREILALSYADQGDAGRANLEFANLTRIANGHAILPVSLPGYAVVKPIQSQNPGPKGGGAGAGSGVSKVDKAKADKAKAEKVKAEKTKAEKAKRDKSGESKQKQPNVPHANAQKQAKAKQSKDLTGFNIGSGSNDVNAKLRSKAVLISPAGSNQKSVVVSESTDEPKAKAKTKATPKPKSQPRPQAQMEPTIDSEEPTEDEVPKPRPAPRPVEMRAKAISPKKGRAASLVPPPPPIIQGFPAMQYVAAPAAAPKARPKAVVKEKSPEPVKEEKSPTQPHTGGGAEEDDFLLDWGAVKKKTK